MIAESERKAPLETGGIFLGWQKTEGRPYIEITHTIGPGPEADHGSHFFEPDYKYQSSETERIFNFAPKGITYLGDWHTHPIGVATLSWQDLFCLHKIAQNPVARNPAPIMMILSGLEDWQPNAWSYRRLFPRLSWGRSAEKLFVEGWQY
jgi:integrative and conjugative element protein (TIGR02256 family)